MAQAKRLVVVMNVFNEARYIKKAIQSIHDTADEIRVYDGAYKNYPHDKPYSTDGTLEIAKEFSKVKVFSNNKKAWKNQMVKRTAMFEDGKPGDYFFKLDGDEYVTNPEEIKGCLDCDVGWVWTLSNLYIKPVKTARIFKYQEGMHYAGRHHWLYNGKKEFITSDQYMNTKFKHKDTPIRVFNFRDSSSKRRWRDKVRFLKNRNPKEQRYDSELKVYGKRARISAHPDRAKSYAPKPTVYDKTSGKKVDYSLISLVSRPWAVKPYLKHLSKMKIPDNTEAVVVIDSDDQQVRGRINHYFRTSSQFKKAVIFFTGNKKLPELTNVVQRRKRIVNNWNLLLTNIRGEIVLGSEDDSLPDYDAYYKLLKTFKKEKADFVQGNIIGRWGARICPAWKIKEKDGEPYAVWSMQEKQEGVDEIDGIGWYCFVAKADVLRKYPVRVEGPMPLGPDLQMGYLLSKNNYKLLHQWGVKVKHFGKDFELVPGEQETEQIMYIKENGKKWKMEKVGIFNSEGLLREVKENG